MMKSSTLRCSFGSIQWSGLKLPFEPSPRGTWQAIFAGKSETSKVSMRLAPLSPLMSRCQVGSTPQASGVTMPSPVTTTRLIFGSLARGQYHILPPPRGRQDNLPIAETARVAPQIAALALCVFFKEFNGVADRQDGLGGVIRDLATEFFLERHDEFDRVEAVGPEIVDEACVLGHLFGFDAQMLHDDLFHPLANITHRCNLVSFELGSIGQRPRAIAVWACVVSAVGSSGRERTPMTIGTVMPPQPNRSSVTILQMP